MAHKAIACKGRFPASMASAAGTVDNKLDPATVAAVLNKFLLSIIYSIDVKGFC
ncbi:hypothetical protein [uncultured Parasutterella sp.]|uniref:hypothetical protein n=1 Tax=uncultured Parasutterella sp. TaxID=1263098 RepID=UPI00259AE08D|nr:hypothetical protein [uncultured Parasutterella sp.]